MGGFSTPLTLEQLAIKPTSVGHKASLWQGARVWHSPFTLPTAPFINACAGCLARPRGQGRSGSSPSRHPHQAAAAAAAAGGGGRGAPASSPSAGAGYPGRGCWGGCPWRRLHPAAAAGGRAAVVRPLCGHGAGGLLRAVRLPRGAAAWVIWGGCREGCGGCVSQGMGWGWGLGAGVCVAQPRGRQPLLLLLRAIASRERGVWPLRDWPSGSGPSGSGSTIAARRPYCVLEAGGC